MNEFPMLSKDALRIFSDHLNDYEKQEIVKFDG